MLSPSDEETQLYIICSGVIQQRPADGTDKQRVTVLPKLIVKVAFEKSQPALNPLFNDLDSSGNDK